MASSGVVEPTCRPVVDPVPDREEQAVLLVHLERLVQGGQDLARVSEIGLRQRLRPQGVQGRDRQQRRADSVAAHVEQVKGEVVLVDPVVAERVAPQLGRRDEPPVGQDIPLLEPVGQERVNIFRGLRHVLGEHLLAGLERLVGFVSLKQIDIRL